MELLMFCECMNKIRQQQKAIDFQKYLIEQLKKPKIKQYFDKYGKKLNKQCGRGGSTICATPHVRH